VLYELLTGQLPLGRFDPPSRRAPVDARLDAVVLRALEREPDRRYQQAADVKREVEAIGQAPAPTGPAGADPRPTAPWAAAAAALSAPTAPAPGRPGGSRPVVVGIGLLVVILSVVGLVLAARSRTGGDTGPLPTAGRPVDEANQFGETALMLAAFHG